MFLGIGCFWRCKLLILPKPNQICLILTNFAQMYQVFPTWIGQGIRLHLQLYGIAYSILSLTLLNYYSTNKIILVFFKVHEAPQQIFKKKVIAIFFDNC